MTNETFEELKELLCNKDFIDTLVEKDVVHTAEELDIGLSITEDFLNEAYIFTNKK